MDRYGLFFIMLCVLCLCNVVANKLSQKNETSTDLKEQSRSSESIEDKLKRLRRLRAEIKELSVELQNSKVKQINSGRSTSERFN
jgi:uncharacterized protein YlxW (UPF0749 family)